MPADNSIDQLVARAILDLELKMKHEIRQVNAQQLARMDKHQQQVDKRLGIIEAKLEALLNRENGGRNSSYSGGGGHVQRYAPRGGKQSGSTSAPRSYFPRMPDGRQLGHGGTPSRAPPMRTQMSGQPYGVFNNTASPMNRPPPHHRQPQGSPHPQQQHYDRKPNRPKQTLGTGGNMTELGEKTLKNNTWTTKIGIYTDDEDSDGSGSQSGSESHYSVAKPAQNGEENDEVEEESDEEEENETVEDENNEEEDDKAEDEEAAKDEPKVKEAGAEGDQEVTEVVSESTQKSTSVVIENGSVKLDGIIDQQDTKSHTSTGQADEEEVVEVEEEVVVSTTVELIKTIAGQIQLQQQEEPTTSSALVQQDTSTVGVGGFGRGRRN